MEDFLDDSVLSFDANLHFKSSYSRWFELGVNDGRLVCFFLEIHFKGLYFLIYISGDWLEDDENLGELLCDGCLNRVGKGSIFVFVVPCRRLVRVAIKAGR